MGRIVLGMLSIFPVGFAALNSFIAVRMVSEILELAGGLHFVDLLLPVGFLSLAAYLLWQVYSSWLAPTPRLVWWICVWAYCTILYGVLVFTSDQEYGVASILTGLGLIGSLALMIYVQRSIHRAIFRES